MTDLIKAENLEPCIEPFNLITLPVDEYKDLIKRSTVLDLLFAQAKKAEYPSDVQAAIKAAMALLYPDSQNKEADPDAE